VISNPEVKRGRGRPRKEENNIHPLEKKTKKGVLRKASTTTTSEALKKAKKK